MSPKTPTTAQVRAVEDKFAAVIESASKMYHLPNLNKQISLTFFSHGKRAGYAKRLIGGNYLIAMNLEALAVDPVDTIEDTVPHEIAHAVAAITGLGRNHDRGWKRICIALGGTGKRCHALKLTPAKRHTKYEYRLSDGSLETVGAKVHGKIQAGNSTYFFRKNRQKLYLLANNFVRVVY